MFTIPLSVPPAPSFPGVEQISGCTTVITVTELFALTGSVPLVATVALLVIVCAVPGEVPVTVMVMGVPSGYATVPSVQVIVPPVRAAQLPCVVVAEAPVTVGGGVSTTVTAVPAARPRF